MSAPAIGPSPKVEGGLPRFIIGGGALHALWSRWAFPQERKALSLLDAALAAGATAFDTAAVYGGGLSETILGRWMRRRRARERVVIISKGGHPDAAGVGRVHPVPLAADLDGSLRRLQTDRIDVYLLHRDDPSVPVSVIMRGLHAFVQAGKVLALGASNWSHTRIEAANSYAYRHGLTPFTSSSPQFSLAEMHTPPWPGCLGIGGDANMEARAWYTATQLPVLAWSPLAGGFLAGRDALDPAQSQAYLSDINHQRRARAQQLAKQRGVPVTQIALAYLVSQAIDVHPIVAASSPEKLRALLAPPPKLSPQELTWLETGATEQPAPRDRDEECPSPS